MERYSLAYLELENLANVAIFHKQHCKDSECGVTLLHLRNTARRLTNYVWQQEKKAAIEILERKIWQ